MKKESDDVSSIPVTINQDRNKSKSGSHINEIISKPENKTIEEDSSSKIKTDTTNNEFQDIDFAMLDDAENQISSPSCISENDLKPECIEEKGKQIFRDTSFCINFKLLIYNFFREQLIEEFIKN